MATCLRYDLTLTHIVKGYWLSRKAFTNRYFIFFRILMEHRWRRPVDVGFRPVPLRYGRRLPLGHIGGSPPHRFNATPDGHLPHREFCRFDYSHDREPRFMPHVNEYEHGVREYRGLPVFNDSLPPPFDPSVPPPPYIWNPPSRLDASHRHSAGRPLLRASMPTFSHSTAPRAAVPAATPPVVSVESELVRQLQAELAEARAELRALREGGPVHAGVALPSEESLQDVVQEAELDSADEGICLSYFTCI